VTAVATVLVIRTQLWLTHYPQLGGHGLHIAHLLWGGMFMAIAIGHALIYANPGSKMPVAVIGGVGFGFFIDELGKFITENNDYFFTPAAALIYLVFVTIFLIIRAQARKQPLRPEERTANAYLAIAGAATNDLNERERYLALQLVRNNGDDPLTTHAAAILEEIKGRPTPPPNIFERFGTAVRKGFYRVVDKPAFPRAFVWLLLVIAVITVLANLELVFSFVTDRPGDEHPNFVNIASIVSSTLSAILIWIGAVEYARGNGEQACRRFELALLIAIFVTSTFGFIESQFGAVFGLGVNIALFAMTRLLARRLATRAAEAASAEPASPVS